MRHRVHLPVMAVFAAAAVFVVVVRLHPGGIHAGRAIDDIGQLLAGAFARLRPAGAALRPGSGPPLAAVVIGDGVLGMR